jgi:hypothetical protein
MRSASNQPPATARTPRNAATPTTVRPAQRIPPTDRDNPTVIGRLIRGSLGPRCHRAVLFACGSKPTPLGAAWSAAEDSHSGVLRGQRPQPGNQLGIVVRHQSILPHRARKPDDLAAPPFTQSHLGRQKAHGFALGRGRRRLFAKSSFIAVISSTCLATIFLIWASSASSSRSRLAFDAPSRRTRFATHRTLPYGSLGGGTARPPGRPLRSPSAPQ